MDFKDVLSNLSSVNADEEKKEELRRQVGLMEFCVIMHDNFKNKAEKEKKQTGIWWKEQASVHKKAAKNIARELKLI